MWRRKRRHGGAQRGTEGPQKQWGTKCVFSKCSSCAWAGQAADKGNKVRAGAGGFAEAWAGCAEGEQETWFRAGTKQMFWWKTGSGQASPH